MNTPTDRIPDFERADGGYGRREPAASGAEHRERLDPETLEVVQKFESIYAELAASDSPPPQPQAEAVSPEDDLFVDLPDAFSSPPSREDLRPARLGPATPLRSVDAPPKAAPARIAPPEEAVELEDAFALLRAAESQARPVKARDRVDPDEPVESPAASVRALPRREERRMPPAPIAAAATPDWAAQARTLWPKIAAAAAVALLVGTGLGFIAGQNADSDSAGAKIEVSPGGGTQLRFDYDLDRR